MYTKNNTLDTSHTPSITEETTYITGETSSKLGHFTDFYALLNLMFPLYTGGNN